MPRLTEFLRGYAPFEELLERAATAEKAGVEARLAGPSFVHPFLTAAIAGRRPWHDTALLVVAANQEAALELEHELSLYCPERPVVCLEADGSAMYSLSALWTQAREELNVTTVILNNGCYAILRMELHRVGVAETGDKAAELLDLSRPNIDFVALATGMGVPATRATTCEELAEQLRAAFAEPGPHLIEAILAPLF